MAIARRALETARTVTGLGVAEEDLTCRRNAGKDGNERKDILHLDVEMYLRVLIVLDVESGARGWAVVNEMMGGSLAFIPWG